MGDENIIGIAVILVILAIGLVFFDLGKLSFDRDEDVVAAGSPMEHNGSVVGRDVHGCFVDQGYVWDSGELACVDYSKAGVFRYQVMDFESCKDAGYVVTGSSPKRCEAPNGNVFVEDLAGYG